MAHAEEWESAVRYASNYIDDEMAVKFSRACCLFGSVDDIVNRVVAMVELGVNSIFLREVGSYTLPHELIETFGDEVLPRARNLIAGR